MESCSRWSAFPQGIHWLRNSAVRYPSTQEQTALNSEMLLQIHYWSIKEHGQPERKKQLLACKKRKKEQNISKYRHVIFADVFRNELYIKLGCESICKFFGVS